MGVKEEDHLGGVVSLNGCLGQGRFGHHRMGKAGTRHDQAHEERQQAQSALEPMRQKRHGVFSQALGRWGVTMGSAGLGFEGMTGHGLTKIPDGAWDFVTVCDHLIEGTEGPVPIALVNNQRGQEFDDIHAMPRHLA